MLDPQLADDLNLLSRFLAAPSELPAKVDLIVILGSALPVNATHGASLFHRGLADQILISGGIGHSTPLLWANLEDHDIDTDNRSEADIFHELLTAHYKVPEEKILVEFSSTNCGANATESKKLLDSLGIDPQSLILIQDPTMQLRSQASFAKSFPNAKLYNSPPFTPLITENRLAHEGWDFDRFIELVLGEIPRFEAYGPKGKGFIAHVDVPPEIRAAWLRLAETFPDQIRTAIN